MQLTGLFGLMSLMPKRREYLLKLKTHENWKALKTAPESLNLGGAG
jgi:hypothetical protein